MDYAKTKRHFLRRVFNSWRNRKQRVGERVSLLKVPHFYDTIAVAAYNRIFDEAIESYGLVITLMA